MSFISLNPSNQSTIKGSGVVRKAEQSPMKNKGVLFGEERLEFHVEDNGPASTVVAKRWHKDVCFTWYKEEWQADFTIGIKSTTFPDSVEQSKILFSYLRAFQFNLFSSLFWRRTFEVPRGRQRPCLDGRSKKVAQRCARAENSDVINNGLFSHFSLFCLKWNPIFTLTFHLHFIYYTIWTGFFRMENRKWPSCKTMVTIRDKGCHLVPKSSKDFRVKLGRWHYSIEIFRFTSTDRHKKKFPIQCGKSKRIIASRYTFSAFRWPRIFAWNEIKIELKLYCNNVFTFHFAKNDMPKNKGWILLKSASWLWISLLYIDLTFELRTCIHI